ncbi:MAG: hypothetical protein AAF791_00935 [Bacteroidota bacterium]
MGYLFVQILLCLLLAFLLGLIIGWLLRGARRADCDECEEKLSAARARIVELERDLSTARSTVAAAPAPTPPAPTPPPAAAAAAPMALFGAPAEAPVDDLKVISGIGPVIEKQLAGIGVTTYRQIANFTEEDVVRVNKAIEVFQGRIEREEWIPQAARLHREKYNTEP